MSALFIFRYCRHFRYFSLMPHYFSMLTPPRHRLRRFYCHLPRAIAGQTRIRCHFAAAASPLSPLSFHPPATFSLSFAISFIFSPISLRLIFSSTLSLPPFSRRPLFSIDFLRFHYFDISRFRDALRAAQPPFSASPPCCIHLFLTPPYFIAEFHITPCQRDRLFAPHCQLSEVAEPSRPS